MTPCLYVDGGLWQILTGLQLEYFKRELDGRFHGLGYESDETDPEVIFSAPDHIDHEEVEFLASNEPELTITDMESLDLNQLDVLII